MKRGALAGAFFLLSFILYILGMDGALMFYALTTAVVLVLMILIQSGRGGGLAALGGMDSEAVLGTHSATPIAKATYVVGALFIFTCMLSARLGLKGREASEGIDEGALPQQQREAPMQPGGMEPSQEQPAQESTGEQTGGAESSGETEKGQSE